ncbi:MAG: ABC transporter ATP-binding protein [Burkholderiaceae bacterium]|nr:ABC transporter ATP-binding protein [Burkholderiaceae bacterium]
MLEIDCVTKRFGGLVALDEVSLNIAEREIVGIFGPNGSGKTTLMNVISGAFPATSGDVRWRGASLSGMRPDQIAARGIVKTFQNPQLFRELTVADNVRIAGHLYLKSELGLGRALTLFPGQRRRATDAELNRRVAQALELSHLDAFASDPASSLSYGGEKMLGVAMALMCKPDMLLLDEPGSGLSHDELSALSVVLRRLRDQGMTLCVIDHRVGFLGKLADRAMVLFHGSKIAEGPPQEVLREKSVIEAYLGEQADA